MWLLDRLLTRAITRGALLLTTSDGKTHLYGDPAAEPVRIRLADSATAGRIGRNPALATGEAFMDGRLIVESGDIMDLLQLVTANLRWDRCNDLHVSLWNQQRIAAKWDELNARARSKRNVAHHYDLSDKLYDLFLDPERQYSCAYFREGNQGPDSSLEQAQIDKLDHIAKKLCLKPGMRVLDIGCGWGGMARHIHRVSGAEVLGVTLSEEQLKYARSKARELGIDGKVRYELMDYRDVQGPFDRIVSVGMFEHVGTAHFRTFYNKCRELLSPEGVMLIHTIGRVEGPGITDAFTQKYIFPGGYIPALSEMIQGSEGTRLMVTDVEVLRMHYGLTIREWYKRTMAHKAEIVALYDEKFFRLWTFYLAGAATVFEHGGMVNYQVQYVRDRRTLPITRDYMIEAEAALRGR